VAGGSLSLMRDCKRLAIALTPPPSPGTSCRLFAPLCPLPTRQSRLAQPAALCGTGPARAYPYSVQVQALVLVHCVVALLYPRPFGLSLHQLPSPCPPSRVTSCPTIPIVEPQTIDCHTPAPIVIIIWVDVYQQETKIPLPVPVLYARTPPPFVNCMESQEIPPDAERSLHL